ncbi:MAG: hypothetical protein D6694_06105 [Gammaproteobacteria bacterium]|nr:MAG: hypothetical protein D6694_06105 [Gammaproteobacteria bacterium]
MTVIKGLPLRQPIPASLVKINQSFFVLIGETRALKIPVPKNFQLTGTAAYAEVTIEQTKPTPRFTIRLFNRPATTGKHTAQPLTSADKTAASKSLVSTLPSHKPRAQADNQLTSSAHAAIGQSSAIKGVTTSKDVVRSVLTTTSRAFDLQTTAALTQVGDSASPLTAARRFWKLLALPPATLPRIARTYLEKLALPPAPIAALSHGRVDEQRVAQALRRWGEDPWQQLASVLPTATNSQVARLIRDNQVMRHIKMLEFLFFLRARDLSGNISEKISSNVWESIALHMMAVPKRGQSQPTPVDQWAELLIRQLGNLLVHKSQSENRQPERHINPNDATLLNVFTIPFPHKDSQVAIHIYREPKTRKRTANTSQIYRLTLSFDFGSDKHIEVDVEMGKSHMAMEFQASPFFYQRLRPARLKHLEQSLSKLFPNKSVHLNKILKVSETNKSTFTGKHWEV